MSGQEIFSDKDEGNSTETFESENLWAANKEKLSLLSWSLKGVGNIKYS